MDDSLIENGKLWKVAIFGYVVLHCPNEICVSTKNNSFQYYVCMFIDFLLK